MALLSALGMVIKPAISPLFNLLTDFIKIPGGSTTAGISMLFLVFGAALTEKKGTAFLMGLIQAVISLALGLSAAGGLLVFITFTLPGVAVDLILTTGLFRKLPMAPRMMLAGTLGVLAGSILSNALYFRLDPLPFFLFYTLGILSGSLGGLLAWMIRQRLPKQLLHGAEYEK